MKHLYVVLAMTYCLGGCGGGGASEATGTPDGGSNLGSQTGPISQLLAKPDPLTWVITGDSVTMGAKHTNGERSYPEDFAERVRYEMGRMSDMVVNSAISGNRTQDILDGFDWRIARFKPNVVIVMIGMNDCAHGPAGRDKFEQGLQSLVDHIQAIAAIPVLENTNTISDSDTSRQDLAAYNEVIGRVALKNKLVLVDNWKHWTQASDTGSWRNDAIHPNGRGHREIAIETFKTLGIFDPSSPTCRSRKD